MHEQRDRYLWLLVILAVLGAGVPSFVTSGTPASAGPPAAATAVDDSHPGEDAAPAAEPGELPPTFFGPLQAMLACEQPPPSVRHAEPDFGAWVEHCRLSDVAQQREAIVAIVPDPLDSMYEHTFDRLLEAIDRAAGQAGYVRDRYYLPWQSDLASRRRGSRNGAPPATHEHEVAPGLLLFRRDCPAPPPGAAALGTPCLLAVLLVGETSAWGVHHEVMERALLVADSLETDPGSRPLRILGPTFSGSIPSLREELDHFFCEHAMRHHGFHVVSGSATNPNNRDVMTAWWPPDLRCRMARWSANDWSVADGPEITYDAAVTDDDLTLRSFYQWLARTMDLRLRPAPAPPCTLEGVGILTETDTMYARQFATSAGDTVSSADQPTSPDQCTGTGPDSRLRPELVVRYPSRVAHLRSIYERTRRHSASAAQLPIEDPRRMLDLSLVDSDEPVEALPAFSDKTQFADELVFTGSLKAMCRSDLRFLGIIGTDIIDRLFLAREVRRYCPNLRLFTVESDVLFVHPDVGDEMNGSLIVTTYPLFPQNGAWTPPIARGTIAPFGDSTAQGAYNAALRLLRLKHAELFDHLPPVAGAPPRDQYPIWVSAGGNGTLWPVAMLDPGGADTELPAFVTSGQWKWTFAAIWLVCTAVAAGYWLGRYLPHLRIPGLGVFRVFRPVDGRAIEHAVFSLLALVPVTCAYVAFASLVLVERVLQQPRSSQFFEDSLLNGLIVGCHPALPGVPAVVTWLALVAACADALIAPLIAAVAPRLRRRSSETPWLHSGALISVALVVGALLALPRGLVFDRSTWITLQERAIAASSGLSPLLPAGAFAAAVFIAARMQLARMRREAPWVADPMIECGSPAVTGMRALHDRTLATVHQFGGGPWPAALLTAVTVAVWGLGGIPRAMTMLEGRVWNGPLTLAVLAGLVLAIASYVAFALGCRRLRGYLRRHANLPCVDAFSRLPGRAAQKMSDILVQPPPVEEMQRALQQLRLLASQVRTIRMPIDDVLRVELHCALSDAPRIEDALARALDPAITPAGREESRGLAQRLLHDAAATLARVVASQWGRPASPHELVATSAGLHALAAGHDRKLPTAELYQRAGDDETRLWLRLAEDFVATQSVAFFHEVLQMLRRLLTTATAAALLLLAGVSSYPFERRPMLLFMMQGLVVAIVIGTVMLLSSMEKSEVLGRIRKVETGKVTWNRSFVVRIAIYGLLPILSVVATQLPSVGSALFGWLPALLGLMQ